MPVLIYTTTKREKWNGSIILRRSTSRLATIHFYTTKNGNKNAAQRGKKLAQTRLLRSVTPKIEPMFFWCLLRKPFLYAASSATEKDGLTIWKSLMLVAIRNSQTASINKQTIKVAIYSPCDHLPKRLMKKDSSDTVVVYRKQFSAHFVIRLRHKVRGRIWIISQQKMAN